MIAKKVAVRMADGELVVADLGCTGTFLAGGKPGQVLGKLSDAEDDIGWVDGITREEIQEMIQSAIAENLKGRD